MSDGKQNYERMKARRDMADEIRRASLIREDRERDMMLIFAATVACMAAGLIGGRDYDVGDLAQNALDALDAAKAQAETANPLQAIPSEDAAS